MLNFHVIRWRNFLSTGSQFTEVFLDKSTTTLIIGENGAGKSTILDAICYALFNKPFRNINKPQLVNSINQKQMVVEVEFSIGTKQYKIIRGTKPSIFEIYLHDTLINQDAAARDYQKYLEDHVLKLNYKSFTQIVILGSASFTPFMQLSAAARREVIEDLLDVKIFSTMYNVLKQKNNDIKATINNIESDIEINKHKAKIQQEYIKTLEEDQQTKVNNILARIEETNNEITTLTESIKQHQDTISNLKSTIIDASEKRNKYLEVNKLINKLLERIKAHNKNISFYNDNDVCPTCNQALDDSIKQTAIETHTVKKDEIDTAIEQLQLQISSLSSRISEIENVEKDIEVENTQISKLNTKLSAAVLFNQKLDEEYKQHNTSDSSNIEDEKQALKGLAKNIVDLTTQRTKQSEDKYYLDVAGLLLKDTGIKTRVIKQYLPVINKLVNKYLQAMDFFVTFELDEAFNETIKSRHRDEFSYASFSEGEKAKIDLSLLFAWRTIARMKNSANTNLLLLDEVFDGSLDINGTDYVMTILNTIGNESNIFIISHKDSLFDKFKSVIRFEKYQNFSRIAK